MAILAVILVLGAIVRVADVSNEVQQTTFGTTDANGFTPAIGDSTGGPPSRRLKAECDSIIAKENRIKSKRAAREKAEEKRKDEAYDKAHPTH